MKFVLNTFLLTFLFSFFSATSAGTKFSQPATQSSADTSNVTCKNILISMQRIPGVMAISYKGQFHEESIDKNFKGCLITLSGSWKELGKNTEPTEVLYRTLSENGWNPENKYSADGPDGTFFSFTKNNEWVVVRGMWDGGDDSDPAYVPYDIYQVIIIIGTPAGN